MPGKKPASAMPSRTRAALNVHSPVTNIMPMETSPQPIMMRAIQRRAPTRSRTRLLGISKRQ